MPFNTPYPSWVEGNSVMLMPYIHSMSFIEFFERATKADIDNLIDSLESYIRYEINNSHLEDVKIQVFLDKVKSVYDNAMKNDIPVAFVPASMGYVDIVNLIPGNTYRYTVKAVSAERRESAEGVVVTAIPKAEAMIISEYKTTANGNDVTVSIDIKNNEAGDDVTAQLILAVYNGVTLETITGTTVTNIPQTALGATPVTLTKTVTVPSGHKMVMYLWNSMSGMRPLKASQEY
jgi:hypothetical protein